MAASIYTHDSRDVVGIEPVGYSWAPDGAQTGPCFVISAVDARDPGNTVDAYISIEDAVDLANYILSMVNITDIKYTFKDGVL